MKHHHVPHCMLHPLPSDNDLDPVGQRLSSLWLAIDNVCEVNIKRLYGDGVKMLSGSIQLRSHADDLRRMAKELDEAADKLSERSRKVLDQPMEAAE